MGASFAAPLCDACREPRAWAPGLRHSYGGYIGAWNTNRYRPRFPIPKPLGLPESAWDDCLCGARHIEAGRRRPAPSLVPDVVYPSGGGRRLDFALLPCHKGPKTVGWAEPKIITLLQWTRGRDWVERDVVPDYERGGDDLSPEEREARGWLAAHKAELAEPKDEDKPTERLPKLTEAPVCPCCNALGTLKRVRRGLKVCSACHVAMPWRRHRVARPDFITRLAWKIDPDQHGDAGLDERPLVYTLDLDRPATRKNDVAMNFSDDAPEEDATAYEASTYEDERERLEAAFAWAMLRAKRLRRAAIEAGRRQVILGGDKVDLTVKTVRTKAERRRGMQLPKKDEPPLLVVKNHETAAWLHGAYWRQEMYRLAQRALATIAEKIDRPAPLPLEEEDVILGHVVGSVGLLRSSEFVVSTRDSARFHRRWCRDRLTDLADRRPGRLAERLAQARWQFSILDADFSDTPETARNK